MTVKKLIKRLLLFRIWSEVRTVWKIRPRELFFKEIKQHRFSRNNRDHELSMIRNIDKVFSRVKYALVTLFFLSTYGFNSINCSHRLMCQCSAYNFDIFQIERVRIVGLPTGLKGYRDNRFIADISRLHA